MKVIILYLMKRKLIKLINNIINIFLVVATIYAALLQYRVSHAPLLTVTSRGDVLSVYDGTTYKVKVKNVGSATCLDTFLIVKEIRKKRKIDGRKIKNQYHLSKPTREIESGTELELIIRKKDNSNDFKEVKFMVVYMDSFGRKYLASDVMEGELVNGQAPPNKHLQRFAKPTKPLVFWRPKRWIYKIWMRKSIKQNNTYIEKSNLYVKDDKK